MACNCSGNCRRPPYTCSGYGWESPYPAAPFPAPYLPPQPILYPVGCICPPGANKDCARPDCPRKNALDFKPISQGAST